MKYNHRTCTLVLDVPNLEGLFTLVAKALVVFLVLFEQTASASQLNNNSPQQTFDSSCEYTVLSGREMRVVFLPEQITKMNDTQLLDLLTFRIGEINDSFDAKLWYQNYISALREWALRNPDKNLADVPAPEFADLRIKIIADLENIDLPKNGMDNEAEVKKELLANAQVEVSSKSAHISAEVQLDNKETAELQNFKAARLPVVNPEATLIEQLHSQVLEGFKSLHPDHPEKGSFLYLFKQFALFYKLRKSVRDYRQVNSVFESVAAQIKILEQGYFSDSDDVLVRQIMPFLLIDIVQDDQTPVEDILKLTHLEASIPAHYFRYELSDSIRVHLIQADTGIDIIHDFNHGIDILKGLLSSAPFFNGSFADPTPFAKAPRSVFSDPEHWESFRSTFFTPFDAYDRMYLEIRSMGFDLPFNKDVMLALQTASFEGVRLNSIPGSRPLFARLNKDEYKKVKRFLMKNISGYSESDKVNTVANFITLQFNAMTNFAFGYPPDWGYPFDFNQDYIEANPELGEPLVERALQAHQWIAEQLHSN